MIYLDNAATTRPKAEVIQAIIDSCQKLYGNPSSAHIMGLEAEKIIKNSREKVARVLGVKAAEIIFTSGGTESNNLAIKGAAYARKKYGRHIITTAIEHPSVLETCQALEKEGYQLTVLSVDPHGYINLEELIEAIRPDTVIVSVMHVNNETGVIQPVADIGRVIKGKNKNTLFHVDAVQSFGKLQIKPTSSCIDLVSLSGHKIHGPKGTGALFIKDGVRITPLFNGGGQEREIRSGTENVPGIAGLGAAVDQTPINNSDNNYLIDLYDYFKRNLIEQIPDIRINSPVDGVPYILNVSFRGVKGEVLLHSLEQKNIFVSTGSACSTKKFTASRVLQELGLDKKELEGGIRFSFTMENTKAELETVIKATKAIVEELRKYARR